MVRGRKPKPLALRVINGNAGKRPLPAAEPKPTGAPLPAPPEDYGPEAAREWEFMLREAPPGMLTAYDASAMTVWAEASARHRSLALMVARTGPLLKDKNNGGVRINPLMRALNQSAMLMLRAGEQLGMAPTARARIASGRDERDSDDPWAQFGAG